MLISFLLVLLSFGQQSSLKTKVKLDGSTTTCVITYAFPDLSSSRKIQYRKVGSESWQGISSLGQHGKVEVGNFEADALYETRLKWKSSDGENITSISKHFKTFAFLTSEKTDFENQKILTPELHKSYKAHTLLRRKVSFFYPDKYLSEGQLIGEIHDANNLLMSRFVIKKNEEALYHIDFTQLKFSWNLDETYFLKLHDGRNSPKWLSIQLAEMEENLTSSIAAKPMFIDCETGEASVIQYVGNLVGGSYPFDLSWIVQDENSANVLFGPAKAHSLKEEEVPTITVEYSLPYVITLSGFDGCGLFTESSLLVQCSNSDDGNSILFEVINNSGEQNSGNGAE